MRKQRILGLPRGQSVSARRRHPTASLRFRARFAVETLESRVLLSGQIFVANSGDSTVGKYNASSGGMINVPLVSGLSYPWGIAVSGSNLFVTNNVTDTIGEYTTSGGMMNPSLVSGLNQPDGIAVSDDGADLFVSNSGSGTIGEYTRSGGLVKASLVSGLNGPSGIAVSGPDLFVANYFAGTIGEYTTSGAMVNASLVTGLNNPSGIAASDDGADLFVTNSGSGTIGEYTTSGAMVNASLISGLSGTPLDLAVSGSVLFVTRISAGTIGEYTTSGATVNASLVSGLAGPIGIAVTTGLDTFIGDGDGTNWTDPMNWSNGQVPGPTDNVVINLADNRTIQLASGIQSINSLISSDPISITGGTLAVATTAQFSANVTVAGGTITGGTFAGTGGAQFTAMTGTLNDVTLDSNLTLNAAGSSQVNVLGGLTLDDGATVTLIPTEFGTVLNFVGTQTVTGNGQILLTDANNTSLAVTDAAPGTPATLTVDVGITVHGQGMISGSPDAALVNKGTILADVAGATLALTIANFTNQGTAQGLNGGILQLPSSGNLTFTGGTTTVSGITSAANVSVSGGEATFVGTAPITVQNLTLSGGTLDGSAPITVTGSSMFTGGVMAGTGTTTIAPGATADVGGVITSMRALDNAGTVNVIAGSLVLDGGGMQTGSFALGTGTSLTLGGNAAQNFAAGSSLFGGGTVRFDQGDAATLQGAYAVGSTLVQDQASITILAAATTGEMIATGGTVVIGSLASPSGAGAAAPAASPVSVPVVVGNTTILSGTASYIVEPGSSYQAGEYFLIDGGEPVVNLASDNSSPATLILGGNLDVTASSGSFAILSSGSGAKPGEVDLGGGPCVFTVNLNDDLMISAQVTDGSLSNDGGGVLELMSADTYGGGTNVGDGIVRIGDPTALGSGRVTFVGGMLSVPAGGAISNSITTGAANSITLNVGSGSLQLSSPFLGAALAVTGLPGGLLTLSGSITLENDLVIDNTVPLTIDGVIIGAFGITKTDIGTLTLAGSSSNTYTGTTTIDGGTLLLNKTGGAVAIPAGLSVVPYAGAGVAKSAVVRLMAGQQISSDSALSFDSTYGTATLDLNGFGQTAQSLSIQNANGTAIVGNGPGDAAAGKTLTVSTLSIASGQTLDLTGNNLQVQYTSGNDPIASIRRYLVSGYGGGSWTGMGIMSSTAAAAGRTLGYADSAGNAVNGLPANTIVVKYTYPGDANLDGSVNFADLVVFAQHYGTANTTWDEGDFSYGGKVNFTDLVELAQNYNKSLSTVAASAALTPAFQTADRTSDAQNKSRHRSLRHSGHRAEIETRREEAKKFNNG